MSSPYEEELKRLISECKLKLLSLKKDNASSKKIVGVEQDLQTLKSDLKRFQKSMTRYREKPAEPSNSTTAPSS
jgi:hypothetical protein